MDENYFQLFSTSVELDSQNCLSVCYFRLSPILDKMSQKLPYILIQALGRFLRSRLFDLSFPEPVMGITRITHSRSRGSRVLCYLMLFDVLCYDVKCYQ